MSDYKLDYWEEAVSNSLEENGLLNLMPKEAINKIAKDMVNAAECQSMAFGWDAIPSPAKAEKSSEAKRYEARIKELENEILCYRKSVASRRGVPLEQVHVDQHGDVIYARY